MHWKANPPNRKRTSGNTLRRHYDKRGLTLEFSKGALKTVRFREPFAHREALPNGLRIGLSRSAVRKIMGSPPAFTSHEDRYEKGAIIVRYRNDLAVEILLVAASGASLPPDSDDLTEGVA